ncbi:hypothetical protein E3O10_00105 [Cryobacterium luteum]|uniref:Uncharacterized protein n=1 Tax=Cryobacterium luteum TaxID=1424661 RepID=A0A5F0DEY2_9MICO|nr:hypothetical protein E3O10_00105 [Cryobacterium luteum]
MGGQLGADVLQNATEDAARRRVRHVTRPRPDVGNVGAVDGDVGGVRFPSPRHRNVQVLARHARRHDDVRGIGREALRPVRGDRVAQVDVLSEVRRGQQHRAPPPPTLPLHLDRTVPMHADHVPPVAVPHPAARRKQSPIVPTGDDHVTDGGAGSVVQGDLVQRVDATLQNQFGASAHVQRRDRLVRVADQHGQLARADVRTPRLVGSIRHRLGAAIAQAIVSGIPVNHVGVALAQFEGRGLLPLVQEEVHVNEFVRKSGRRSTGGVLSPCAGAAAQIVEFTKGLTPSK